MCYSWGTPCSSARNMDRPSSRAADKVRLSYCKTVCPYTGLCWSLHCELMFSIRHITHYELMYRENDLNRWKAKHFERFSWLHPRIPLFSVYSPSSEMAVWSFFKNVCQNVLYIFPYQNLNRAILNQSPAKC